MLWLNDISVWAAPTSLCYTDIYIYVGELSWVAQTYSKA